MPGHTGAGHKPGDKGRELSRTTLGEHTVLNGGRFGTLTVGPTSGPRAKNARAFPRTSQSHMSPSIALQWPSQPGTESEWERKAHQLLVRGAAAKNPPRKRKMRRAAVLGAKAFPT